VDAGPGPATVEGAARSTAIPRINVAVDHGRPVGGEGIFHYFMIARMGGLPAPSIRLCLP